MGQTKIHTYQPSVPCLKVLVWYGDGGIHFCRYCWKVDNQPSRIVPSGIGRVLFSQGTPFDKDILKKRVKNEAYENTAENLTSVFL